MRDDTDLDVDDYVGLRLFFSLKNARLKSHTISNPARRRKGSLAVVKIEIEARTPYGLSSLLQELESTYLEQEEAEKPKQAAKKQPDQLPAPPLKLTWRGGQ